MVNTDLVLTVTDTMAFEVEYKPAGKTGHFLPWQFIETGSWQVQQCGQQAITVNICQMLMVRKALYQELYKH